MKRVCYFGIFDPEQYRTKIIKSGLVHAGYDIVECHVNPRAVKGFKKYLLLFKDFKKKKGDGFNFIVVGFPGYFTVFLAFLISRSPIILDSYISYFDGVRDRRGVSVFNPISVFAWLVDFFNGIVADIILTINPTYRDFYINTLKVSRKKVEVLHKGADESVFYQQEFNQSSEFTVGWWGSFIPLHGLPVIIDAANLLRKERDIIFEIVGKGQLESFIKNQIKKYGLNNVRTISYVPQVDLVKRVSSYTIALGIFAKTPKSGRCVTNKVYEAMAMGKPIITQDSRANSEFFVHKKNAYLVPAGDPKALSDAILYLYRNSDLRQEMAENVRQLFNDNFTKEQIVDEFIRVLNRHNLNV